MSSSCVYILYSEKLDKYYIGSTDNLALRLHIHNHPHEGIKFTAKGLPWLLKCKIDCRDKTSSLALERRIKSMKSRAHYPFTKRMKDTVWPAFAKGFE